MGGQKESLCEQRRNISAFPSGFSFLQITLSHCVIKWIFVHIGTGHFTYVAVCMKLSLTREEKEKRPMR